MKKRLFITTGLISLINSMAIIDQLSQQQNNSDDYKNDLIIYTAALNDNFIYINKKLLIDNYFKDVKFAENINITENYDEIYSTAQPIFNFWNNYCNINLFEEGISSYYSFDEINYNNICTIYLSNYFGKIKYQNSRDINKVIEIKRECVLNIINKIRAKNNLDFSDFRKKNLVLCLSQYVYQDFMSDEEVTLFYKKHIDALLKNDYSVLFKSHPRVNDTITECLNREYENNPRVEFMPIYNNYPAELMIPDLDLKAIVTSVSGGAISCSHLFNISCYGFGAELVRSKHPMDNIKNYTNVFLEYIPHIRKLYEPSLIKR